MISRKIVREVALAIGCSIAGYLAFWAPWKLALQAGRSVATNPIDGMQFATIILLPIIGFAAGLFLSERYWLGGASTVALLPLITIVEIFKEPKSHNLLGIEFMIYGFLALPGIIGGYLGKKTRASRTLAKFWSKGRGTA